MCREVDALLQHAPPLPKMVVRFNDTLCNTIDGAVSQQGLQAVLWEYDRLMRSTTWRSAHTTDGSPIPKVDPDGSPYVAIEDVRAGPLRVMAASSAIVVPALNSMSIRLARSATESLETHRQLSLVFVGVYTAVAVLLVAVALRRTLHVMSRRVLVARRVLLMMGEAMLQAVPQVVWLIKNAAHELQLAHRRKEIRGSVSGSCCATAPIGLSALKTVRQE